MGKEDDTAAFLVGGGGPQSAKSRTLSSANPIVRFLKTVIGFFKLSTCYQFMLTTCLVLIHLVRILLVDKSFLLENRLILRAM